ncbi:MAG: thioredoxin domain-containing protein [Candidatus Dojkabacteria bacterium]|jgi:protein-disulfide isomerase
MSKSKKKEGSKEEVVINLDNLGVPIAIIVSGIIIATVIFFASKNVTSVKTPSEDKQEDSIAQDDYIPEETGEGVALLEDGAFIGNPDTATVAVIEYSDYFCGFCQRHFNETFPSIKEKYVDTGDVLYVFKKFPLSNPGELGFDVAEGSVCTYKLSDADTFLKFHEKAFSLSSKDQIVELAVELGVDEDDFTTCFNGNTYRENVKSMLEEGRDMGISGTPGFLVGAIKDDGTVEGELIFGAYPFETFADTIEAFL